MATLYDDFFEETGKREDGASFDDAECLRETERAILVSLGKPGGPRRERWVPKSQLLDSSEVLKPGDRGELRVTDWFADRFDDGVGGDRRSNEKPVAVGDVRVVRESEKAICIQIGDDDEGEGVWIPKSHIAPNSPVKADGDVGTILVTAWIAGQKGLGGEQKSPATTTTKAHRELGRDLPDQEADAPFLVGPDDDIPF